MVNAERKMVLCCIEGNAFVREQIPADECFCFGVRLNDLFKLFGACFGKVRIVNS